MDRVTKAKRGEIMSKIRHGNTQIEQALRNQLWTVGLKGYKISPNLPGKPDIFYSKFKFAIFVDGCFWHGCEKCRRFPKSNVKFWNSKISRNKARDRKNCADLRSMNIKVIRIWEHEIKLKPNKIIEKIAKMMVQK